MPFLCLRRTESISEAIVGLIVIANSDAIDAMPESLHESLNVSASIDLKSAKLFVASASRM